MIELDTIHAASITMNAMFLNTNYIILYYVLENLSWRKICSRSWNGYLSYSYPIHFSVGDGRGGVVVGGILGVFCCLAHFQFDTWSKQMHFFIQKYFGLECIKIIEVKLKTICITILCRRRQLQYNFMLNSRFITTYSLGTENHVDITCVVKCWCQTLFLGRKYIFLINYICLSVQYSYDKNIMLIIFVTF